MATQNPTTRDHFLSSKTYDRLKQLAQIGLPALGTLYFALSQIWGLPNGDKVVGTIVAIDAFLGIVLGYSSKSYNKSQSKYDGTIEVEQTNEGLKRFSLNLNGDPNDLDSQEEVKFKVTPVSFE